MAGKKPTPIAAANSFSLSVLAHGFGCSREHLRRKLDDARVAPSGERGGHPVYRLRDVVEAWGMDRTDTNKMDPVQRRAHYQAELEQLELETRKREVIPRIEVEQEQARVAKVITQMLDTLPDVLERDCGLAPAQVARVEERIDQVRMELHADLAGEEEDAQEATA